MKSTSRYWTVFPRLLFNLYIDYIQSYTNYIGIVAMVGEDCDFRNISVLVWKAAVIADCHILIKEIKNAKQFSIFFQLSSVWKTV